MRRSQSHTLKHPTTSKWEGKPLGRSRWASVPSIGDGWVALGTMSCRMVPLQTFPGSSLCWETSFCLCNIQSDSMKTRAFLQTGVGSLQLCTGSEGRCSPCLTCPNRHCPFCASPASQHTDPGRLQHEPAPRPHFLWHGGVSERQEGHGHRGPNSRHRRCGGKCVSCPLGELCPSAWLIAEESLRTRPAEAVGCLPPEHWRGEGPVCEGSSPLLSASFCWTSEPDAKGLARPAQLKDQ